MYLRTVEAYELEKLKKDCESCIIELIDSVNSYCDNASEVDSVIKVLKEFYNSEGGDYKIGEIENIDVLGDSMKGLVDWANGIKIDYYKSKLIVK